MKWHVVIGAAALATCASASNFCVPLTATTWSMPDGTAPRTVGVPFPQGRAPHLIHLRLLDARSREPLPAQFEPLARWPDGSLRWVAVDFATDPSRNSLRAYVVTPDPFSASPPPAQPVVVTQDATSITVDTGVARFVVARSGFAPFTSVRVGATELLRGTTDLVLDQGGTLFRASADATTTWTIEGGGPLRATLLATGTFRDASGNALLRHRTRLHFFAGESLVKVETTLQDPQAAVHFDNTWDLGSPGSVLFDDLSLALPLAGAGPMTWTTWPSGTERSGTLSDDVALYQESSGGDRWDWQTHVNRFDVVPMTLRGWQLREGPFSIDSGDRALGELDLSSATGGVTAAHRFFWQEFPKALRARADGTLEASFFPGEFPDQHELQGGEEKTHELQLFFHEGSAAQALPRETLDEMIAPRLPEIGRETTETTLAAGLFGQGCTNCDAYFETIDYIAHDHGVRSFLTQREAIDEYGWRNFGEAFADHETDCGTQCWDCPVSHDNNQYDSAWVELMNWLRTGDDAWMSLADEAVRHLRDVDVYHTDADTPVYDRGMFWHTTHDTNAYTSTHRSFSALMSSACTPYLSGGPGLDHLYTEGLQLHGWITGDARSNEVHEELEQYLVTRYGIDAPAPGSGYEPRAWANALRTAVEACRRDDQAPACLLADRIVQDSDALLNPSMDGTSFQDSMLMVSLGRYLDWKHDRGERLDAMGRRAFASLEELARRVRADRMPANDVLDFRFAEGLWATWIHAPQDDPDKASWATLARATFDAGQSTSWFRTYITQKGLTHVASNGQLACWVEAPVPAPITDLRVRIDPADRSMVRLTWSPIASDVHGNPFTCRYHVHEAPDRPTRFTENEALPVAVQAVDVPADSLGSLTFYDVRGIGELEGE